MAVGLVPINFANKSSESALSVYPVPGGGGGGGYLTKFYTGRLRPEGQPLTLSYTILVEKVPLLHTFH